MIENNTHGLGIADPARKGDWCQVYPARRFWPLDPRPEEIEIETIAHALALQCRFGGHCREPYSVAEHSLRVSYHCDPEDALWGLLHDAAEAYLCDLPRPIKCQPEYAVYREHEARIMAAVCERFGLPPQMPQSVRVADEVLLATEARDLIGPHVLTEWRLAYAPLDDGYLIEPLHWSMAKRAFLRRFEGLTRP